MHGVDNVSDFDLDINAYDIRIGSSARQDELSTAVRAVASVGLAPRDKSSEWTKRAINEARFLQFDP